MQETDIDELTSKASLLMLRFEQRCQTIEQQHHVLVRHVEHLTLQAPQAVKQSLDNALRTLPEQINEKVDGRLRSTIDDYERRLHAAGKEVDQRAQQLGQQMMRLERLHRMLVWKVVGVTATALALLLTGGLWLSMHYDSVIRDKQLSAETLQVYSAADLVRCGDGLCANVDLKGLRYGNHSEYVPIKRH